MYLVDENTPQLYLAHWTGFFHQREEAAAVTETAGTEQKPKLTTKEKGKAAKGRATKGKGRSKMSNAKGNKAGMPGLNSRVFANESGTLSVKTLSVIGEETVDSCQSIPSTFGKAFHYIKYHISYKATELLNFTYLIVQSF